MDGDFKSIRIQRNNIKTNQEKVEGDSFQKVCQSLFSHIATSHQNNMCYSCSDIALKISFSHLYLIAHVYCPCSKHYFHIKMFSVVCLNCVHLSLAYCFSHCENTWKIYCGNYLKKLFIKLRMKALHLSIIHCP